MIKSLSIATLGLLAAQATPAPSAAPSAPAGALAELRARFNATATSVRVMTLLAPT